MINNKSLQLFYKITSSFRLNFDFSAETLTFHKIEHKTRVNIKGLV